MSDDLEERRWMTAKAFAKELGVGAELVHGLVKGGQIEGFRQKSKTGHTITLVYRDQLDRFRDTR